MVGMTFHSSHGVTNGWDVSLTDVVEFLRLQLISVFFFAGTIPIAGLLVDRFGRRRTLLAVSIGILGYGAAFSPLLAQDHVLAFLVIGMSLTGLAYGPMSAVLPELFPTNVRYSGSGVSSTSRASWVRRSHRSSLPG
jgi:MFS family permease